MARNVASHVLELARATGTSLKAYEVAERHMQVVQKTEGSKGDISGIYGAVRLESGLKYENK